jgi:hypothetical protein
VHYLRHRSELCSCESDLDMWHLLAQNTLNGWCLLGRGSAFSRHSWRTPNVDACRLTPVHPRKQQHALIGRGSIAWSKDHTEWAYRSYHVTAPTFKTLVGSKLFSVNSILAVSCSLMKPCRQASKYVASQVQKQILCKSCQSKG